MIGQLAAVRRHSRQAIVLTYCQSSLALSQATRLISVQIYCALSAAFAFPTLVGLRLCDDDGSTSTGTGTGAVAVAVAGPSP